jgi:6-phosphogluconolactonase/glucosamine-6-phosphate isomerase/deaminase
MNLHQSPQPAAAAAGHISRLARSATGNVLCLLAGGSAMDIYQYLETDTKSRTIFMMGDERASGERATGNYTQLVDRYGTADTATVVDTSFQTSEGLDDYATRLSTLLNELNQQHQFALTISIQGIGADGHTSGIFPMDQKQFRNTYEADVPYVPVRLSGLTIDSRASLTPAWLLANVNVMIGYAVGQSKAAVVRRLTRDAEYVISDMPGSILKQHPDSHVYTDVEI